jgi:short-subunit dehydrogenase
VLTLGEALHVEFQNKGVHVTVLLPGATDTPMLAASGLGPDKLPVKPMSPKQCVAEGLAALSANRTTQIAGSLNRVMAALMPRPLAVRMYGSLTQQFMVERNASATTKVIGTN